jgi:hypothetical protein
MATYRRDGAGLRLKPSADGLIECDRLTSDTRATLLGISTEGLGLRIRIQRDGIKSPELWARRFWIPLRGARQWPKDLRPKEQP